MSIGKYTKSLAALVVTLLTAFLSYAEDYVLSPDEIQAIGALALATIAAWLLPNERDPGEIITVEPPAEVARPGGGWETELPPRSSV